MRWNHLSTPIYNYGKLSCLGPKFSTPRRSSVPTIPSSDHCSATFLPILGSQFPWSLRLGIYASYALYFYIFMPCQKFVCFYLFSTLNSFFPQKLIPSHMFSPSLWLLPHVSSPLSYSIFTIHTKSKPLRTPAKLIQTTIEDRSYLLARLLTRHLLPSDTISQGFTRWQLPQPLLHELVMRLYISRYWVQGDSQWQWSLMIGWRGNRWQNQNWYQTLQPWGDILRRRQWEVIEVIDGLHPSLPCSPTPIELTVQCLTHQWPFTRCRLPPPDLEPPSQHIAIFTRQRAQFLTMRQTTLSCLHGTSVRLLHTQRARRPLWNLIVNNKGILLWPGANSKQGIYCLEAVNLILEIFNLQFWVSLTT